MNRRGRATGETTSGLASNLKRPCSIATYSCAPILARRHIKRALTASSNSCTARSSSDRQRRNAECTLRARPMQGRRVCRGRWALPSFPKRGRRLRPVATMYRSTAAAYTRLRTAPATSAAANRAAIVVTRRARSISRPKSKRRSPRSATHPTVKSSGRFLTTNIALIVGRKKRSRSLYGRLAPIRLAPVRLGPVAHAKL